MGSDETTPLWLGNGLIFCPFWGWGEGRDANFFWNKVACLFLFSTDMLFFLFFQQTGRRAARRCIHDPLLGADVVHERPRHDPRLVRDAGAAPVVQEGAAAPLGDRGGGAGAAAASLAAAQPRLFLAAAAAADVDVVVIVAGVGLGVAVARTSKVVVGGHDGQQGPVALQGRGRNGRGKDRRRCGHLGAADGRGGRIRGHGGGWGYLWQRDGQ